MRRTDSDYTLTAGAPHHKFAVSGTHNVAGICSSILPDAGAAYTYDAMLRVQPPAFASPNNWIQASVFGLVDGSGVTRSNNEILLNMSQGQTSSESHSNSGIIWTNSQGEIFLEASGYDPATKGFIEIDVIYTMCLVIFCMEQL